MWFVEAYKLKRDVTRIHTLCKNAKVLFLATLYNKKCDGPNVDL